MHRIPNVDLIRGEKELVRLVKHFRCLSFDQIHMYHVLRGLERPENMERTLSKMRHLAVKYHFSCFEAERMFAYVRTDLDVPDVTTPMWIYLDFVQLKIAGAFVSTDIPYTPIVFEERGERQLIEIVMVPREQSEIQRMNQELYLYDQSLEGEERRRRLFVIHDRCQMEYIHAGHCYIGALVHGANVEYISMGGNDEKEKSIL